jgi:Fur family transcriptional regulator, peroxide stress response regulator
MIIHEDGPDPKPTPPRSSERIDRMTRKLKERGYRLTPQRLAVVRILAESREHPTAEKIYERVVADFPTTSLATVYKTLAVLKDVGEVLEIGFGEGGNRYDGAHPNPHPHLICTRCGKILDPDMEFLDGIPERVTRETGFRVADHRMDFFGLCAECQAAEEPASGD